MKQVNILAEKLSNYDFTAETDDEGKNEFTEMNRSLKTVIENIKEAIRTVKKCRNFKSKFRKLISSIRRISIIFARTCRDYARSRRRDIYSGK
ncbi:methyl-accepting chemotaxis protein [Caldanaerobacter subterraneus]|uniref:methyl-accepting chemotaxis protein n=1 Tax=Caldanaerobacter subterraneus TaxID=911092 RepID=UPI00191C65E4|nr:methyl-accepting chemotaxis protein [Caldanaerobacter subterraneus]